MNNKLLLFLLVLLLNCKSKNEPDSNLYSPIEFASPKLPVLHADSMLIHKGIFSPDLTCFYYTISDVEFSKFDIYYTQKKSDGWSPPKRAFFNSEFNEHGMSFSTDGNTVFFSSTRPVNDEDVTPTWQLWRSDKIGEYWSEPTHIKIPGLAGKSISHPSLSASGNIYFHASNTDYSEMHLYTAQLNKGSYLEAQQIEFKKSTVLACTPFIAPAEEFLIFASIGSGLKLMISFKNENNQWGVPKAINSNSEKGVQGNPWVTPDGKFLFYTVGNEPLPGNKADWEIRWQPLKK